MINSHFGISIYGNYTIINKRCFSSRFGCVACISNDDNFGVSFQYYKIKMSHDFDEDLTIIRPAVKFLQDSNIDIKGPLPADTIFVKSTRNKFDIIHAIYHDQGLVPFKMIAFDTGVNVTLNLPFVRTSPDHGTGYDIAGMNKASSSSMEEAILLAVKIYKSFQL